jgi:formate hydrogenlyase subunit 6/NADH:ubiquinone oxidoreductase subunit I
MRFGTMLSDVVRALFRRPVTELYPFERQAAPRRLRGLLQFNSELCTGCALCVKDCPASAIELITVDKASKRFVLRYHVDRCTFCAQCVQSCRYKCLFMSSDQWELAALNTKPFVLNYGREPDVESVMARPARPGANAADKK